LRTKREISEKKWAEARQWAGSWITKAKYMTPASQKPDGVVAGSAKMLASRFYQPKTGPVFYIDQSGIILGKVGTGRDIVSNQTAAPSQKSYFCSALPSGITSG
jgi:hypothetical protein